MVALARYRWRAMNSFVLDAARGELVKLRGKRPIERWVLTEVLEFTCVWDWLHRSFTQHYWLVARTHQGRSLRLGKAPRDEAMRTLQLLHSWGLPARW